MCEPQIDARRAENVSTSVPVLAGTSQQPAPRTTSTQAASSKKAAGSSGWYGQQKKHAGECEMIHIIL
jgi:hypothetical protein